MLPNLEAQRRGDLMIALGSSGPHSNGYSLIRRIVELTGLAWDAPSPFAPGRNPCRGPAHADADLRRRACCRSPRPGLLKGCAHITGGGLIENPPRAIAEGLAPRFDWSAWALPPVFAWLSKAGGVADHEMRRTFNCGVGLVLIASPRDAEAVLAALLNAGETAFVCGELAPA